jgi:hypothetical protein
LACGCILLVIVKEPHFTQSYPPYCAKTRSVEPAETADGVFGFHYCEKSKRTGGTIVSRGRQDWFPPQFSRATRTTPSQGQRLAGRIRISLRLCKTTSRARATAKRQRSYRGSIEMKQPVIKFEPVHWWILLIVLLVGVAIFIAFHIHAY